MVVVRKKELLIDERLEEYLCTADMTRYPFSVEGDLRHKISEVQCYR